jgi:hypothetical protein
MVAWWVAESVVEKVDDLAVPMVDYSADLSADCSVVQSVVPMAVYSADSLVGLSGVHSLACLVFHSVVCLAD